MLNLLIWLQVGLKGEYLRIYANDEKEIVEWSELSRDSTATGFSWYKVFSWTFVLHAWLS